MNKITLYVIIFAMTTSMFSCNKNNEKTTFENDLLPTSLRMAYRVNNTDSLFPNNFETVGNKNFVNTIFEKILAEEVKAYHPVDTGEYFPYSILLSNQISLEEILLRMDAYPNYDTKEDNEIEINTAEIESILFFEDWFFNEKEFIFKKDVVGYVPVRKFYTKDDSTRRHPKLKMIFRILPTKDKTTETIETAKKQAVLVKKVEFEFMFNDSEADLEKKATECFSCLKKNGETIENYMSPYFNSITQRKLINIILNKVQKGEISIYDAWERDKIMDANEIKTRMGAETKTMLLPNPETGEIEETEVETEMDKRQIKSIIFIEEWYMDSNTLLMTKKVKGIIPVRHFYREDDSDNENIIKKKLFLVKFE